MCIEGWWWRPERKGCPKPRRQALVLVFGVGREKLGRKAFRKNKKRTLLGDGLPLSCSPCRGITSMLVVVVAM